MSDLRYMKTTGDVSLDRLLLELQSRIATLERASTTPPTSASTASVTVSNGGGAYKSVTLLSDLSDVSIASPAANNGLIWSGTYWINNPVVISVNGLTGTPSVVAGTGVSVSAAGSSITVANTGVLSLNGATGAVTVQAGTGLSRSVVAGDTTLANTGVLSVVAGTGIGSTGGQNPSISNTGVLSVNGLSGTPSVVAGTGVSVSAAGSSITVANTAVLSLNGATGAVLTAVDGYINQSTAGQTTTFKVPLWKRGDL